MLHALKQIDPQILQLRSADGAVLVSKHLQGRIFAEIEGELIHNFVPELAAHPSPDEFNNLGGNSLWPAPEGGDFAYNYPTGGNWTVQWTGCRPAVIFPPRIFCWEHGRWSNCREPKASSHSAAA